MDPKENQSDSPSVNLEDLLKLKRCEQPDESFWSAFELSFEKRTLKELVKKPSFKETFAHWLAHSGRRWLPASAVAAAALFFANQALIVGPAAMSGPDIREAVSTEEDLFSLTEGSTDERIPTRSNSFTEVAQSSRDQSDAPELDWSRARANYALDVIVADSREESITQSYVASPDVDDLSPNYVIRTSYAEDVISSNIATIYPSTFRLGI